MVRLHPFWTNPTLRAERFPLAIKLMINSRRLQKVLTTEVVIVTQRGAMNTEKCSCDAPGLLSSSKMSEQLPVANDALLILREVETNLFS